MSNATSTYAHPDPAIAAAATAIDVIRRAFARDASAEERARGAEASAAICAALRTPVGQPLAQPAPFVPLLSPSSPLGALLARLAALPADQLGQLAAQLVTRIRTLFPQSPQSGAAS